MAQRVSITRRGAWAKAVGMPREFAEAHLRPADPKREHVPAYKRGAWDGHRALYEFASDGFRFPAGLVPFVARKLREEGFRVHEPKALDNHGDLNPDDFGADYLSDTLGKDLWPWQVDGGKAMIENPCGSLRIPTSGGKTYLCGAIARFFWEQADWTTLIVTSKKGLAKQTARAIRQVVGPHIDVGQCGDGQKSTGIITCATAQTLVGYKPRRRTVKGRTVVTPANPALRDVLFNSEVLIFDEAHHTSAATWYDMGMVSKAHRRYGMSGTPFKHEALYDMQLIGATGQLIHNTEPSEIISAGRSAQPKIAMVMHENASHEYIGEVWRTVEVRRGNGTVKKKIKAKATWQDAYLQGIVNSERHNRAVVLATMWMIDRGRRTLVICRRKDQWLLLKKLLKDQGVSHKALWGDTDTEVRDAAKRALDEGSIRCILATTIFDEGEDVAGIDAIVLAEGVKSSVNAVQRIGRGMRKEDDGYHDVWVVDFVPLCHKRPREHAAERCEGYEDQSGFEVRLVTDWPDPEDASYFATDWPDLLPFENWS